ncbi:hypothetical protein PYCCODRAFT_1477197 [Trametes coccinea BRFM310]|uniref:Ubiquitin-like protease family profile domain-containing protein n=1 Tax=Trametes coccinea (strain BRFM310) TaxID=1353009 RepID=A0A1Y2IQI7_TRAC3|nr:hypothetical protein PYCCODRAFT_1477197 [Trametes coccinea BRFM310]
MDDSRELPVLPPPATPGPKAPRRAEQPVGKHFMTPETRRPSRKTAVTVTRPDLDLRFKRLNAKLDSLMKADQPAQTSGAAGESVDDVDMAEPSSDPDAFMEDSFADAIADDSGVEGDGTTKRSRPRHEDSLKSVHAAWLKLIPTVLEDYLEYLREAHNRTVRAQPDWRFSCPTGDCYVQTTTILSLHFDYLTSIQVSFCECRSISQRLVSNGLFPTSPSQPRVAISIDLLDFYFALFERSADAVSALAGALKTFYERRGFPVLDSKGEPVRDPFRRGLSNAIQWYDQLRRRHDSMLELAIDNCMELVEERLSKRAAVGTVANPSEKPAEADMYAMEVSTPHVTGREESMGTHPGSMPITPTPPLHGSTTMQAQQLQPSSEQRPHEPTSETVSYRSRENSSKAPFGDTRDWQKALANPSNPSLSTAPAPSTDHDLLTQATIQSALSSTERTLVPGRCHRILQKRCPACFGGTRFGRDFRRDGGDIHLAMDATFSQRHNVSAGDSPWHYEAEFFISKEQVDAVGDRIAAARKKGAKPFSSRVPETALDECRKSFEAADEKKEKTTGKKFDDTGVMALVCRHDIVLFLANIDTPGEQQKFAISLLEHFFSLIPVSATVVALYDIGCVLDRSVQRYDILPASIVERLDFATSAMHAYGHQWSCQIVYNPRLREGLGLTEGEGTERVWSKFCKLIGVTRTSGRSRRVWILDRHARYINEISRIDLGLWVRNKLKNGVDAREAIAMKQLEECGIAIEELRHQWDLQQTAQLSEKRHAPARVKKELDAVLGLQTELESIQQHLVTVQESIKSGGDNPTSQHFLESLRQSHARTVTKVDDLYASLNVSEGFPELQHLPFEFVRVLLLARDLKINIRKRAIGSFFEWDKLDRAAGGRDQPLGTKLHQQTRKAIAKRTPALMTAIRKFNGYCDSLQAMNKPEWNVSLPCRLPTELGALRDDSSLLTDVWIAPTENDAPRWLEDPDIRLGIRALLARDRCREERRRLGEEADNLCGSYGRELAAVELALRMPQYQNILFFLQQRKDQLLLLQARWRTPLVSDLRFDAHTRDASSIAQEISGISSAPPQLNWILLPFTDVLDSSAPWEIMEDPASADVLLACDTLDELVGDNPDGPPDASAVSLVQTQLDFEHQPQAEQSSELHTPRLQRPEMIVQCVLYLTAVDEAAHTIDIAPFPDYENVPFDLTSETTLVIPAVDNLERIIFPPKELRRLGRRTAWLSDDCINGGAQALLRCYGHSSTLGGIPALLSSRVFTLHRDDIDDDRLWRDCCRTQYWMKGIWILPIHRVQPCAHWTLAVVYWREGRIAYFDSLADKDVWEHDVQIVYTLSHRLHRIAGERQAHHMPPHNDWEAYPLAETPLQTNGYDCGVWVLACIAALLRGYHSVQLSPTGIAQFRSDLLGLIVSLAQQVQAP